MNVKMLCMIIASMMIGGASGIAGYGYYARRFENGEVQVVQRRKIMMASILCSSMSAVLFCIYGYSVIGIVSRILLIAVLPVIAFIDRKEMVIPNRILGLLVAIRLLFFVAECIASPGEFVTGLIRMGSGALCGSVVFLLVRLVSKQGIGMGDIKLFAVIGIYMGGMSVIYSMLASFLIAGICCGVRAAKKELHLKDSLSFGSYIAAGTILMMGLGV